MKIFLNPHQDRPSPIASVYDKAFREAESLYIASAYLTDWSAERKLGTGCRHLFFLVGTDFGVTRKAALHAVLKWIPKNESDVSFMAVDSRQKGGFHPKLMAWKSQAGSYHCLIGSSNLSKAAFETNAEANALSTISRDEFERVGLWLEGLSQDATPVTSDWIEHHYHEAATGGGGSPAHPHVLLQLPAGKSCEDTVTHRRYQKRAFKEIGPRIRDAVGRCARGADSSAEFWSRFWGLWGNHQSRFQGSGLQIKAKAANWREACSALQKILTTAPSLSNIRLDALVSKEIDKLAIAKNPARRAWLSEMLCHYLPQKYPIINGPVSKWLSVNRWRARRGATEGQYYIQLAQQLRYALRQRPAGARDFPELDAAIWQWANDHGLLAKTSTS
jgi:hypothetical protein